MPPFNPDAPGPNGPVNPVFSGSTETLDVNRTDDLTVAVSSSFPNVVVNLAAPNTEWIGSFPQTIPGSHLSVTGAGIFDNIGTSTVDAAAIVGVRVAGSGTFADTGKLEFMHR